MPLDTTHVSFTLLLLLAHTNSTYHTVTIAYKTAYDHELSGLLLPTFILEPRIIL